MLIQDRATLSRIIEEAASALDVPDHVYEDAVVKYEDVADHLASETSDLANLHPQIYCQGSFRLGTAVAPLAAENEYDIDLVCRLDLKKTSTTQADLKKRVGDRLKQREDFERTLEESRRCWRINYPGLPGEPKFHLDVLPAIPTEALESEGIYITDKDLFKWQYSNPIAYSDWFVSQMKVIFEQKRLALAEAAASDVEEVPIWQVKTPLQRSIQILKRHRDIYFDGDPDDCPISIIITTLAARAYRNEADIFDALTGIVQRMPLHIENRDGIWWVANPVEPNENFADRWNEYPSRKTAFEKWLQQVTRDFAELAQSKSESEGRVVLSQHLEKKSSSARELLRYGSRPSNLPVVPPVGTTSHVLQPSFRVAEVNSAKATLRADLYWRGRRKKLWQVVASRPVPKNLELKFTLNTNATGRYTVRWQVVNTGDEARVADNLRGDFYDSDPGTRNNRWESTKYKGTHWVQAFVLDEYGICICKTEKFFVKIR